jgi:hypothetical protein
LPHRFHRHNDRPIPGIPKRRHASNNDICKGPMDLRLTVYPGHGLPMHGRKYLPQLEGHIGANHCFVLGCEDTPCRRAKLAPLGQQVGARTNDRELLIIITKGNRRHIRHTGICLQLLQYPPRHQVQGCQLQIHRREDKLRRAATGANQQVKRRCRLGTATAQRPLLRTDGHTQSRGQGNDTDYRHTPRQGTPHVSDHHGEWIQHDETSPRSLSSPGAYCTRLPWSKW